MQRLSSSFMLAILRAPLKLFRSRIKIYDTFRGRSLMADPRRISRDALALWYAEECCEFRSRRDGIGKDLEFLDVVTISMIATERGITLNTPPDYKVKQWIIFLWLLTQLMRLRIPIYSANKYYKFKI